MSKTHFIRGFLCFIINAISFICNRLKVTDSKNVSTTLTQDGLLICDCNSNDTQATCNWASIQTSPNFHSRQVACQCSKYYSGSNCQTFIDYCTIAGNICDLYPGFGNNMVCTSLTSVSPTTGLTYTCTGTCAAGFVKDSLGVCQDVNECAISTSCPPQATCINQIGSFSCNCPPGFVYSATKNTCESKYQIELSLLHIHLNSYSYNF